MAAVVRVKRRINEEPLSAFILNCKKPKFEDDSNSTAAVRENLLESKDEISTILKFAGTVESQDENIGSQITKLSREDAKKLISKSRKPNISERNRKEMRQNIHENRFKVINCFRTIQNDNENDESIPKEITVVDIEKHTEPEISEPITNGEIHEQEQQNHNQSQQCTSSHSQSQDQGMTPSTSAQQNLNNYYVYDLYIPDTNDQQNLNVDYDPTYLSIRPFDDLLNEGFNNDDDEDSMNESEDSNAEDNWRNDYPDTEESVSDSDMRKAAENYDCEDGLSSDEDYYEGYVHSEDFPDDMDYNEYSNRYGSSYAKYRARIMRTDEHENSDENDFDENSDND